MQDWYGQQIRGDEVARETISIDFRRLLLGNPDLSYRWDVDEAWVLQHSWDFLSEVEQAAATSLGWDERLWNADSLQQTVLNAVSFES